MPQPNDLSRFLVAQQNGFAQDSVLEGTGFELLVPLGDGPL